MRITRVRLAGWKVFPDPVDVPLAALPGTITAVCGANGAGKSTLATLATLGALYREGPGGQSPNALAAARDATVEITVQVGRDTYNLRQTFDGAKGGGKALLTDAATGRPVDGCRSGQIKEYNAWRAGRLPDLDVAQASMVLGQGARGILGLGDTERASVVLRALGGERLERLADAARKRATLLEADLTATVALLEAERARSGDVAAATAALATARAALDAATARRQMAKAALSRAEARAAAEAQHGAATRRMAGLTSQVTGARAAVANADQTRRNAQAAVAQDAEIAGLERQHSEAAQTARTAAAQVAAAEAAVADAQARAERSRERLAARLSALSAQRAEVEARATDIATRLANNRRLLADATEIRAAAARLAEIDAGMATLEAQVAARLSDVATLTMRVEALDGYVADYAGRVERWRADRMAAAREWQACRDAMAAAQAALPEAQAEAAVLASQAAWSLQQAKTQREDLATAWERRHGKLWTFATAVAGGAPPMPAAARVLANDAELAAEAATLPDAVRTSEAEHAILVQAHAAKVADVQRLEAIAGRTDALRQHEGAAALCATQEATAQADLDRATAERAEKANAARTAQEEADAADYQRARLATQRQAVEPRARYAARLDAVEERIADLGASHADAERALARAQEEADAVTSAEMAEQHAAQAAATERTREAMVARDYERDARAIAATHARRLEKARALRGQLGDTAGALATLAVADAALRVLEPQAAEADAEAHAAHAVLAGLADAPAVPDARAECDAAEDAERCAATAVTRAEGAAALATQGAAAVTALEAKRRQQEVTLADTRHLAEDLGRRGIQADLVDGAAPTLTALTNELLRAANVTRWTVRFATAKTRKSDGAEVVAFPLMVRDETTGEERDGHTFSGGETVLIDAGASNAVAALACQRAGIDGAVLVRDEVGAALDAQNERAWMAMLRRMASMTGASRVLVITHSPTMRAMCDSALEVGGGAVREVDPAA